MERFTHRHNSTSFAVTPAGSPGSRNAFHNGGFLKESTLAYLAGGLSRASAAMLLLIVPLWAIGRGWTPAVTGLEVGAIFAGPLVLALPIGRMVDRLGARKVVLLGSLLGGGAASMCALATAPGTLAGLLVLAGLGQSALWIAAQAAVGGPSGGSFAFLSSAAQGGNVVGPVVGGLIASSAGDRAVFMLAGGTLAIAACIAALTAGPSGCPGGNGAVGGIGTMVRHAGVLLRRREVGLLLTATMLRVAIVVVRGSFYPLFLHSHGFSKAITGLLVGTAALVGVGAAQMSDKLPKLLPGRGRLLAGMAGASAAIALAPAAPWLVPQLAIAALLGASLGISQPTLFSEFNRLIPQQVRGLAVGIRTSVARASQLALPIALGAVTGTLSLSAALAVLGGTGVLLTGALAKSLRGYDYESVD